MYFHYNCPPRDYISFRSDEHYRTRVRLRKSDHTQRNLTVNQLERLLEVEMGPMLDSVLESPSGQALAYHTFGMYLRRAHANRFVCNL